MRRLLAASLLILVSCATRPAPVPDDQARSVALLELPFAELSVPPDSRPEGRPPPDHIPLGPWVPVSGTHRLQRWQTRLPVRPRTMFFMAPPPTGMELLDAQGKPVTSFYDAKMDEVRWSFDEHSLTITAPLGHTPVPQTSWFLSWAKAKAREDMLNFSLSGSDDPAEFARATIQDGPESRRGVLLPAPGVAAWDVEVPPAAELHFAPGIVPPEIADGPPSDGVTLTWEVQVGQQTTTVWQEHITPRDPFHPVHVDLSRWAGQSIRLRLRSDPGPDATFDYAFVGDPIVSSREEHGRRVVLIFVDTVRHDHVGLYGYQRPTTPHIDAWAKDGVVFDDARSVAPWTLPTARSLLTGRHPELYDASQTLPERLRKAGFATAMFAANVYLSSNFDINRDWGLHEVENDVSAKTEVDRTLAWLQENEGRDQFVLLHFMDCHLPYHEPTSYRHLWAGKAPKVLGDTFYRGKVLRSPMGSAERAYIKDRYDQNIRYVDDQLQRVFDVLDEHDTVIFLSDHGEEFWDHGDYEHGQSLYDELLRVPLIVKAPGLTPDRVTQPVSLLDVAPTILALAGVDHDGMDGEDLRPVLTGDAKARAALNDRDQVFGRLLYGDTQWGMLRGHMKYVTRDGDERLFDVARDPRERHALTPAPEEAARYRDRIAKALGTPVRVGFRVVPNEVAGWPVDDLMAQITVPGGVDDAFPADDPTGHSGARIAIHGDTVTVVWPRSYPMQREVFIVPTASFDEAKEGLQAHLVFGDQVADYTLGKNYMMHARRRALALLTIGGRSLRVDREVIPLPMKNAEPIRGYDDELSSMLQAMGYAVGGANDDANGDDDSDGGDGSE